MVTSRILIFSLIIGIVYAATALMKLPPIPEKFGPKQGCYIEEIDDVVEFGTEVKPLGNCIRINCGSEFIHYATCGSVGTDDPKCHKTDYDLTKIYPECCPTIECDIDNTIDLDV